MLIKSITASSIGNILEWYDFGLFAMYSTLFSQIFFPSSYPNVAFITTLTVFAIGFLCRPIGALLFGILGDRKGRVKTLRFSILMISLPTLLIGCLPTYATIGIAAPILLMLVRIWQGISIGGEYSGNIIYLAEMSPTRYRATMTSLAGAGANFGILLATLVGILSHTVFSETIFREWGWRVPYLLSGILSLIVYRARLQMQETMVFEHLKNQKLITSNPIKTVFNHQFLELLRTVGLVCVGTTFYYFCFIYTPMFLFKNHFSFMEVSSLMTLLLVTMIVLVPIAGRICDAVGRRHMLLFNAFFIMLIIIPGFYIMQKNYLPGILFVLFIFVIASSLEQGATPTALVENYPAVTRYTGLSLGYNLGNGLLGGTIPVVSEYLIVKTHFSLAPAFYVAACAAITGLIALFFVKETQHVDLI